MISFRYFALILLVLCLREAATEANQTINWLMSSIVVASLLFGFAILAKAAGLRAVQRSTIDGVQFDWLAREYFHRARGRLELLWCILSPLVMLVTGWMNWSIQLQQSGWSQAILLGLCFAPTILFLAFVELTGAQLDQLRNKPINQQQVLSKLIQSWKTRLRLGEVSGLITCLLPVLLVASVSDLSGFFAQQWGFDKTVSVTTMSVGLALVFVAIFPAVLTKLTGGTALPKRLAERVNHLLETCGVTGTSSHLIVSQGRWAGAAIVGWAPGCRRLWLGDGLLNTLSAEEVDMVVLHEAAHVKRHHFVWRLFPVIWSICAGLIVWLAANQFGMEEMLVTKLFAATLSSFLLLFGLGNLARRCELDADRTACNLAVVAAPWAEELSPAEALESALNKLLDGNAAQKQTWLHPSLSQRLDNLRKWHQENRSSPFLSVDLSVADNSQAVTPEFGAQVASNKAVALEAI
ncbi:MAG: M48 family metalloprotease [Pirellulales bacterium]